MRTEEGKNKKAKYDIEYRKKNLKRVVLDLQLPFYEQLKDASDKEGESVSGYIKKAIKTRLESDSKGHNYD